MGERDFQRSEGELLGFRRGGLIGGEGLESADKVLIGKVVLASFGGSIGEGEE